MPTIRLPTWVSHPGRGTLRSMHGTFQPSLSTGAAFVHFPLKLTQARSLTPELSLDYHSNQGNGVFGMGFDLNGLISISRNTKHGVPSYDESDTFVLSTSGELVKVSDEDEQGWTEYRPRVDSQFSKILYHRKQGWVIHQANGVNHYLGEDTSSCVTEPKSSSSPNVDSDNAPRIFEWKVSKTIDALGNEIHYHYDADGADRYLSSLQYGKVPSGEFAFDIVFDYGKEDCESKTLDDQPIWKKSSDRPDQFTSYRSGFALSTKRLCHRIALYHRFDEFSEFPAGKALVKYWALDYNTDETQQGLSSLVSMQEIGCRTEDGVKYLTKALPPATFNYQSIQSKKMELFKLPENSALPGLRGSYQWIDLYREGLPGILYNDDTTALYWRSKGEGEFAAPEPLDKFPNTFHPSVPTHCRVMHLGPSQETAFVVVTPDQAGYYSLNEQETKHTGGTYQPGWQGYHSFEKIPNEFTNHWNEVIDLNGSHQEDLVVLDPAFPRYYPSEGTLGYGEPKPLSIQPDFPLPQFDPEVMVRFVDIFGDGILHRVKVTADGISIWPNLGHGTFGKKIDWDLPVMDKSFIFDARCIFLRDIDGSGAPDFVYVAEDKVYAHLNVGTGFSDKPYVLELPEHYTHDDQLLFGDFFGKAVTSVILIKSDFDEVRHYHGSFSEAKPYLLQEMTQSFGVKTQLTYSTSAAMQRNELEKVNLERNKKGVRDLDVLVGSRLPFSLPVLSKMRVYDPVTHVNVTTSYAYYQGHYDFAERRFCGFGFVQESRGETTVCLENNEKIEIPGHGKIEQSERKHWFHNGVIPDSIQFPPFHDERIKGAEIPSTQVALYYKTKADDQEEIPDSQGKRLIELSTAAQKEAQFSAKGRQWRMELWVSEYPLKIEQLAYNVRCDKEPDETKQSHGVFTMQQRMSVSLQLESPVGDQTPEARITQSVNLKFDLNNNVLKEIHFSFGRSKVNKKIHGVPFELDGDSLERLQATQQNTQVIYKQTQYAKSVSELASKDDSQQLHLVADTQVYDLSEEGVESKTHEDLAALKPTPEQLFHHEQRLYWAANQKDILPVGECFQRALLHHSRMLLGSNDQAKKWYQPLPVGGGESIENLLMKNGYFLSRFLPGPRPEDEATEVWIQPGQIHHYGDEKNYFQIVKIMDAYPKPHKPPSLFHRIEIDRDECQLAPTKIQHYLAAGKPTVTTMKIDYQALQPYQVVDPNRMTHLCVHDPLGVVIAQTRYKAVGEKTIGSFVEGLESKYVSTAYDLMERLDKHDFNSVIAGKKACLDGWLFVKCYHYLDSGSAYTIELRASDYAEKSKRLVAVDKAVKADKESQIYCTVTYFDGSGQVFEKIRQKSKEEWVSSGAQLHDQAGHLLTRYLPHTADPEKYEVIQVPHSEVPKREDGNGGGAEKEAQPAPEICPTSPGEPKPLRNIYDGAFRPVTQHLPNNGQRQTQYHAWYCINFDENTSSKYPNSPQVVFLTPAGKMGGTLKQLDKPKAINILETIRYNIAGQPTHYQDARSVHSLTITYDLIGRVVVRDSVDRGPEYVLHNARGKITRRKLGMHLHENAYDSWERVTGKSVWADSKSDPKWIQTENRVYGDSPEKNQFNQLVSLENEEGVIHFNAFDLGGHCIDYKRQLIIPSLQNLMNQVAPQPHQEEKNPADSMFSFEAKYDALGNILTETLPDGTIYRHQYNALAQLTDITPVLDSEENPISVVSEMDYNAAGLMTEITRGKALKTIQSYDPLTQRLIRVQTGTLQDQTYAYDNVGNVVKMTLGTQELDYSYDSLHRLVSAGGLELSKMPVQSDSKKIAHQVFSADTAIESYTQTFQYDISGNMTQIKHGVDAWHLDFNVSGESNRFEQLTIPNNKQLELPAPQRDENGAVQPSPLSYDSDGKVLPRPLYDAAGNMLKTDENDALEWSHRNELRHVVTAVEVDRVDRIVGKETEGGGAAKELAPAATEKVDEYYGYDASEGVPFEDKIKHRHALGLFGAGLKASRSKLLKSFGNRLFKVSVFHHSSGEFSVVEQIFLGKYQRKRVYTGASIEALKLVLDRVTHRFELDGQPLATYHHWKQDTDKRETEETGEHTQWQYHLSDKLHSSVMDVTEVESEDKELGKKVELVKLSQQAYQPYGAIAYIRTADHKQLQRMDYHYSGKMRDRVTGLYYYGARYYAPQFGRWLTPDPAGLVDGLNLYGMVRNNPMTFLDVWGLMRRVTVDRRRLDQSVGQCNSALAEGVRNHCSAVHEKVSDAWSAAPNVTQGTTDALGAAFSTQQAVGTLSVVTTLSGAAALGAGATGGAGAAATAAAMCGPLGFFAACAAYLGGGPREDLNEVEQGMNGVANSAMGFASLGTVPGQLVSGDSMAVISGFVEGSGATMDLQEGYQRCCGEAENDGDAGGNHGDEGEGTARNSGLQGLPENPGYGSGIYAHAPGEDNQQRAIPRPRVFEHRGELILF